MIATFRNSSHYHISGECPNKTDAIYFNQAKMMKFLISMCLTIGFLLPRTHNNELI